MCLLQSLLSVWALNILNIYFQNNSMKCYTHWMDKVWENESPTEHNAVTKTQCSSWTKFMIMKNIITLNTQAHQCLVFRFTLLARCVVVFIVQCCYWNSRRRLISNDYRMKWMTEMPLFICLLDNKNGRNPIINKHVNKMPMT